MTIIKHRKIFFTISAILVLGSIVAISFFGFKPGIDFTGGSLLEVSYTGTAPALSDVREVVVSVEGVSDATVQPAEQTNFIIRSKSFDVDNKEEVVSSLKTLGELTEERFTSIGPVVGSELKTKSFVALAIVILAIVGFVTFAFRKVSSVKLPQGTRGVPSWKYGLATIIALVHDVVVPTGIFVTIIHFYGGEVDLLFVTALLAILGYSVNDTIVVFDRVRENLRDNQEAKIVEDFDKTVGTSLTQTLGRSINTSLTLLFVLAAIYVLGGTITQDFIFVLILGVVAGTYSSIFLAAPLLVTLQTLQKGKVGQKA